MKIQQPINKQTLMKSNAQLRRDDSDDEVPPPAPIPVRFPDMASSSHTVPPSEPEVNYAQIMEALAALQGGNEQYASDYVLHAAIHLLHTARGALHQQASGAELAGPQGVPEVSSPQQQ
jgi:hypothetical protein